MAVEDHADVLTEAIASARDILVGRSGLLLAQARQGGLNISVRFGCGALWVVARCGEDGGLALRIPVFGADATARVLPCQGQIAAIAWRSAMAQGTFHVAGDGFFGLEQLRIRHDATPLVGFRMGRLPRDLVIFDREGKPDAAGFTLEAQQRKMNTVLLYFTLDRPQMGALLYVQNLSSLNPYFNATGSKPENAVRCDWPELGYSPPLDPETDQAVLRQGQTLVLYDTILAVRAYPQRDEGDSAWQFLDMIGAMYPWLAPPQAEFRNWPARADATIEDLLHAPKRGSSTLATPISIPIRRANIPTSWCNWRSPLRWTTGRVGSGCAIHWCARSLPALRGFTIARSARCAAICPMLARTRTPTRWIVGISIIPCSIWRTWLLRGTRKPARCSLPRSTMASAPRASFPTVGRSFMTSAISR